MRTLVKFTAFFATSSFLAVALYYILKSLFNDYVFGVIMRMPLYHYTKPIPYILIPCFFYAVTASFFSANFAQATSSKRVWLTSLIVFLTILLSLPFGGMLWHFHDMQAGYFPKDWFHILIVEGTLDGLKLGWFIILTSIPYNIIGCVVCYFLTKKLSRLFFVKRQIEN